MSEVEVLDKEVFIETDIEIGSVGAYGRAIAGDFNGYGKYDEVILDDAPLISLYAEDAMPRTAARKR